MNADSLTREQLCAMFDHTNLKAAATAGDFETLCAEASLHRFAMVAVNPYPVALCKRLLEGTGVHVGAAIAFPLGQTSIGAKTFEAEDAIRRGADEIDYVINIGALKDGRLDYITGEMESIVEVCRRFGVISKVIFENCYLTRKEIAMLGGIARQVRPDFIKTSTGFGPGGAKAEDVRLMREAVGDDVGIKASGGIRDWETCKAMIDAGARRIGTSSSLQILAEFEKARG